MRRVVSSDVHYWGLGPDEQFRVFLSAAARQDRRALRRLQMQSTPVRQARMDPAFVKRVDAIRRLTYRMLLAVLSAMSWAEPLPDTDDRCSELWRRLLEADPLEATARELRDLLDGFRRGITRRMEQAVLLWLAFDSFCSEEVGLPVDSVIAAIAPLERGWLDTVKRSVERIHLSPEEIADVVEAMRLSWREIVESEEPDSPLLLV